MRQKIPDANEVSEQEIRPSKLYTLTGCVHQLFSADAICFSAGAQEHDSA